MRAAVLVAGIIVLAFGVVHVAGLRDDVAVLSGAVGRPGQAAGGVLYALLYFVTVIVAPVLVVSAGLHRVLSVLWSRRHRQTNFP